MCALYVHRILSLFKKQLGMTFADTPVVVVLGSTGAGKSKLAIEIAEQFDGEIISADSMQVYKGLDIISNKVTPEEQEQVPHHMIDIVEPTTNYSVVKFRNTCLSIIEDLHRRRKLPVIVGGTNYYIEAVLWKVLVADEEKLGSDSDSPPGSPASEQGGRPPPSPGDGDVAPAVTPATTAATEPADVSRQQLERLSTEQLYDQLRQRDPAQAQVLHPNERRKILRSLEVTLRSGLPMSEHLRLQRAEAGGGALGGPLRFPRACLLWVTAEQATLDRRLDGRVDTMLARGLVAELANFHRRYNESRLRAGGQPDYTRGIFQSIGFKEFHAYLTRPAAAAGDGAEAERLLADGVERLKLVTRRYARKQTRWVRRRFLSAGDRQVPPLFRLDATDPAEWEARVGRPATGVVRAWLAGREPELQPEPPLPAADGDRTTHHCAVCGVYTSGARQRDEHLHSRRHQRALQGRKRRLDREQEAAAKGDGEEVRRAAEGSEAKRASLEDDTAGKETGEMKAVMEQRRDQDLEAERSRLPEGKTAV